MVFNGGVPVTQLVALPLNAEGQVELLSPFTAVDVTIDVVGWHVPADDTWGYTYNPDGLRASKTPPAGTGVGETGFTWDRASGLPMLLAQNQSGVGATYWVYGPGGLPVEQINPDDSTVWLHHDQIGSTRTATDNTGAVVASWTYDPYGNAEARTGTIDVPLGYTGQYTDTETGNQYLRARYYNPETGTFLTRDPLNATTRSAYGYVGGNPLNAIDPSGLWAWDDYCVMGVNCKDDAKSIAEEHAEVTQGVVDLAAGTLDGLTLGNAGIIVQNRTVNASSGWNLTGRISGTLLLVPFALEGGAYFKTAASIAAIGSATSSCLGGPSGIISWNCGAHLAGAAALAAGLNVFGDVQMLNALTLLMYPLEWLYDHAIDGLIEC